MSTEERNQRPGGPIPSFEAYAGSGPENYERYFVPAIGAPLAVDLVQVAGLQVGQRVLDVACGTGVVTRLAAERVGPTGTVTGLDINPGMLAAARAVTPESMAIQWHQASAESSGLPDRAFDVVLCQMGLQFCADKPAVLREIRRLLASSGRLVMNLPGPTPALFAVLEDVLREHVGPQAAGFVAVVFSLHDEQTIRDLLAQAGFEHITVGTETKSLRLPPPAAFLWQYVWSTPLAAALSQLAPQTRAAIERDVVSRWQAFTRDGALALDVNVVTAVAA